MNATKHAGAWAVAAAFFLTVTGLVALVGSNPAAALAAAVVIAVVLMVVYVRMGRQP